MKKLLLFIVVIALIAGCSTKESNDENTVDKWNGYEEYYKAGEMWKELKLRNGTVVGEVTYGIDDDANFYVTYETGDCDDCSDWEIVKTFMYAGEWKQMPKRKRRKPKIKNFPNKDVHDPYVTTYTYTIPLVDLPSAEEPGFVVAAGARVFNPNKCGDNQYTYKKAWAEWDKRFSCRTWGGYSVYYYNGEYDPHTLLYGTEYRNDSLAMYLIDATDGNSTLIATEYVGTPPSETFDGTAWDAETGQFFFTNYELQELWVNNMDSTDSYVVGTLDGIAASATFYDGSFYYVDATMLNGEPVNDLIEVTFNTDPDDGTLTIASQTVFDEIPSAIQVNDIAFEPNGDHIYIIGYYTDPNDVTTVEFIEMEVASQTYSTLVFEDDVQEDAQIAYGNDGELYIVQGNYDGSGTVVSTLDPQTGVVGEEIGGDIVPVPLSDIAGGPIK